MKLHLFFVAMLLSLAAAGSSMAQLWDCVDGCNHYIDAYDWTTPNCYCADIYTCRSDGRWDSDFGGSCIPPHPDEAFKIDIIYCHNQCEQRCEQEGTAFNHRWPPSPFPDDVAATIDWKICSGY